MADTISWAFNAAATSGATTKASGQLPVDAVLVTNQSLKKGPNAVDLGLQLETAAKVHFLAIHSSRPDVTVVGAGAGAKTVTLSGPLVLHGDAVQMFASDLGKLSLKSTVGDAEVSIMIGISLLTP